MGVAIYDHKAGKNSLRMRKQHGEIGAYPSSKFIKLTRKRKQAAYVTFYTLRQLTLNIFRQV